MDLAALRARTRLISGIEMESLRSDPEVDDVINDVYQEFLDAERWPFLEDVDTFPTVAGTADYALPAGIEKPRTVTLELEDGPTVLTEVSHSWVDRNVDGDDTDEPVAYARTGSGITLAPTPDAVYTVQVRGYATRTDLTLDTDEPIFEERFHKGVAYAAAAVLLSEEGQRDRAEAAITQAATTLERMKSFYLESADEMPVVLGAGRILSLRSTQGRLWPGRGGL